MRALVDAGEQRSSARPGRARRRRARRCRLRARARATSPIRRAFAPPSEGCSAVVHLVAILTGKPADFERVMTQGTASLLAAARDAGVERFVQMSALGTSEATKDTVPYYRAKWAIEEAVRGSGLGYAILRPSFVFARRRRALAAVREDRAARARDADDREGNPAAPADLGGRPRTRRDARRAAERRPAGRDRRARRRRLERVLVTAEGGARHAEAGRCTCRSGSCARRRRSWSASRTRR